MSLKGFLGALKCVTYYYCNSIFWSQDHRPVLEKYPHSMLRSPVMLSKCMVAMAKTNKTKHLRQEKEALRNWSNWLRSTAHFYSKQWFNSQWQWLAYETASNKLPLCLNMTSAKSLFDLLSLIQKKKIRTAQHYWSDTCCLINVG